VETEKEIKLSALEVSGVKRIKAVRLKFNKNGLTIIGGRNRQGKTSVLSSIMYALGGENYRPSNFKREGSEEEGFIRLTFDDGMVVERRGKNASLTVIDSTGKKAGQHLLDSFVSKFAIDLPRFMNGSDKEKAEILLKIIGVGDQLKALDEEERVKYEERTLVGRNAEQKEKAVKEIPFWPDVPDEEISMSELTERLQSMLTHNAAIKAASKKIEQNKSRLITLVQGKDGLLKQKSTMAYEMGKRRAVLEKQIEELDASLASQTAEFDKRIEEQGKAIEELATEIAASEDVTESCEDTSAVEAEMRKCEEINAKVRENKSRAEKLKEADALKEEYDELTKQVEDVRRRRKELLDGANLPYPGLSVQNQVLYLNGKAWDCMSGAEQLIVASSIAQAVNPSCRFVLMDGFEQFDLDTLSEYGKWCEDKELQVIATRVSTGDECSIIIEDGQVVGQEDVVIDKTPARSAARAQAETSTERGTGATESKGLSVEELSAICTPSAAEEAAMALLKAKREQMRKTE